MVLFGDTSIASLITGLNHGDKRMGCLPELFHIYFEDVPRLRTLDYDDFDQSIMVLFRHRGPCSTR